MEKVILNIEPTFADKIRTLINIFGNSDLFVDKFVDYHIKRLKREIARMQIELDKYESKYKLQTDTFYKKFEKGEYGDEKDYMLWAGIYELQLDSKKKLSKLL